MGTRARNVTPRPVRPSRARPRKLIDYPRYGKRGLRRWLPSWKLVGGLVLLGVAMVVGLFAVGYAVTTVPAPNAARETETTTVFYSDGTTPMGQFAVENRVIVDSAQIPEHVKQAIISAEDRSFYENRGISPTGIARAFWSNLRGNSTQGGSTITQQYVKNYYLEPEQTYRRKIEEAFVAIKIDQQKDKDEILTSYLNTIYFGRGSYGIQTASQAYFNKNVQDLTPAEAAMLAGIVPAPNSWDPAKNPQKAQERFNYVLDGMVELGYMDAATRAQQQFPAVAEPRTSEVYRGPNGYILAELRNEVLARTEFTEAELDGGGLQIVTTIDKTAQDAAVAAMTNPDVFPTEDRPPTLQAALSAIDPRTGGIRAMWGGADYLARQRNSATQDIAQAGSTFKPFTLVAALESGISLRSRYDGDSNQEFPGFERPVRNFGNRSFGEIDLYRATANSVNTVYVALNEEVGPDKTVDVAVRAGLPEDTNGLEPNLANVLGTPSPHPLDLTHAYATFASYGVNRTPHLVASVSRDGEQLYAPDTTGTQAFQEDVMRDTAAALQGVVENGSGEYAQRLDRPAAGKTGTSTDNKSAWFAGYTPQLAASVALYNVGPNGEVLEMPSFGGVREVTGGSFPVRIWTAFMEAALAGQPVEEFLEPANLGRAPTTTTTTTTPTPTPTTETTTTTEPPTETTTTEPPVPTETITTVEPEPSISIPGPPGQDSGGNEGGPP